MIISLSVAVGVPGADRGVRPPENIVVFGFHRRDQAVADGHVEQREGPRILGERLTLRSAHLTYGLIPHMRSADDGEIPRHVGPILRPLGAVELADILHLVVVLPVPVAGERGWRSRTELVAALIAEGRQVAPMEKDTPGGGTTRRCLPFTRIGRGRHVELGRRGAIVGSVGDHRCCSGLSDGNAFVFGLAVRDCRK